MQELSVCRSAVVHNNAEHLFGSLYTVVSHAQYCMNPRSSTTLMSHHCHSDDRMIPPAAQRSMATRARATVSEEEDSHAIYVSLPTPVAASSSRRRWLCR